MKLKIIIFSFLFILTVSLSKNYGQNFNAKYLNNIKKASETAGKRASSGNSYYFMEISNYINANNIMYSSTKNKQYLNYNSNIIKQIYNTGKVGNKGNSTTPKWVAKFNANSNHHDKHLNNQEVPLYEGYLSRYIAEYCYLLKENGLSNTSEFRNSLDLVKGTFDKWFKKSLESKKDLSLLFRSRIHMGAQWASTALYLYKLTNEAEYLNFINDFNSQLRVNLKVKNVNGNNCYIWNSTYDKSQVKGVQRSFSLSQVQDVSHGNHVVQYIIDSYKLKLGQWQMSDLNKLANTFKYLIWNPTSKTFSDNVDGSNSVESGIKGSGWKTSDGWLKLIEYDKELGVIYTKFYNKNPKLIDNSFLNLQTYSVLSSFL